MMKQRHLSKLRAFGKSKLLFSPAIRVTQVLEMQSMSPFSLTAVQQAKGGGKYEACECYPVMYLEETCSSRAVLIVAWFSKPDILRRG